MQIEQFKDTVKSCRFCFMCRHLSAVGNVTFSETDTPRGRALLLDRALKDPNLLADASVIETIYKHECSASCRMHCVSHFDETGLILAARRDTVSEKNEPEIVRQVKEKLLSSGNPYSGKSAGTGIIITDKASEKADLLLYTGTDAWHAPQAAAAAFTLLDKLQVPFKILKNEASTGKALSVLGYSSDARAQAEKCFKQIAASGCRKIIPLAPGDYDALKNDFPAFNLKFSEDIELISFTEYISKIIRQKKIIPRTPQKNTGFLPSDFFRNYSDIPGAKIIQETIPGFSFARYFSNSEESFSCGEGAIIYDLLYPDLAQKMVQRIISAVPANSQLIAESAYTASIIRKNGFNSVKTPAEFMLELV